MIDTKTRELFIYDDIGPSWAGLVGADRVVEGLRELGPGPVSVRVNSPGGAVDEALAMVEILGRHDGEVTVSVDSLAASAASLFPVAFKSSAARHARIMVHNPWGLVLGSAIDMRKTADILDTYRDSVVAVYEVGMTVSRQDIMDIMDAETWYSAEDAVMVGLVDEVTEPAEKVAAKVISPDRYKNTPSDLIGGDTPPAPNIDENTGQRIAARIRTLKIAAKIRKAKRR